MGTVTGNGAAGFSGTADHAGPVAGFDPVLISLIRRSMPNLVAYDLAGVQPMNGPTGLIFAMRSRYGTNRTTGDETFYNEVNTAFSAQNSTGTATQGNYTGAVDDGVSVGFGTTNGSVVNGTSNDNPGLLNPNGNLAYTTGQGMQTADSEALGQDGGPQFNEMNFSIEKVLVEAKSRALKAEYSLELAQDLKAIHGLNAEAELANILSTEILAEINREVIRTIYKVAKPGAQANVATAGVFDLDVDSNGRWSVERFKGLLFNIERDANVIAQDTRRGKGNFIICSSDVAAALAMAGVLDTGRALQGAPSLDVDDTGNTFVGTISGKKVYVDPYSANTGAASQFYVVGYKGATAYDAGLFYCPYVPLQMVRAIDPNSFQPKIGFKTRYGMIANPYVTQSNGTTDGDTFTANRNQYYRRVKVTNLM